MTTPSAAPAETPPTSPTPGPWTYHDCAVDCGQVWWISPDNKRGLLIGEVNTSGREGDCEYGEPFPRGEWEANRRLFAAAPDLLQIVRRFVGDSSGQFNLLADARAAIALAEGRTNG